MAAVSGPSWTAGGVDPTDASLVGAIRRGSEDRLVSKLAARSGEQQLAPQGPEPNGWRGRPRLRSRRRSGGTLRRRRRPFSACAGCCDQQQHEHQGQGDGNLPMAAPRAVHLPRPLWPGWLAPAQRHIAMAAPSGHEPMPTVRSYRRQKYAPLAREPKAASLGCLSGAGGPRTAAAGGRPQAGLEFVEKVLTRSSPARAVTRHGITLKRQAVRLFGHRSPPR